MFDNFKIVIDILAVIPIASAVTYLIKLGTTSSIEKRLLDTKDTIFMYLTWFLSMFFVAFLALVVGISKKSSILVILSFILIVLIFVCEIIEGFVSLKILYYKDKDGDIIQILNKTNKDYFLVKKINDNSSAIFFKSTEEIFKQKLYLEYKKNIELVPPTLEDFGNASGSLIANTSTENLKQKPKKTITFTIK
ncbi:hypothetical protein KNO54_00440 [Latilactobacillus sakei]|uniref:hypothetical protein n=1 Tax=Latilactobacillus sakei TaxID=1599 RepID=UPI003EBDE8D1